MSGIIDLHSHILPQVDDGSESVAQSVSILEEMARQGIGHVVATPHFYPQSDTPEHFLRRRYEAKRRLFEAIRGRQDLPGISVGAEVYFFQGISDSDAMNELTIDGKKCILTEMPNVQWTDSMYRELEAIYVKRGLIPIIAHIDRYLQPFRSGKMLKRLAELPVLVQANAEFFLEKRTAKTALRMLEKEQIHLLGSDCHNLRSRKPNLAGAMELIERKLGQQALEHICACQRDVWR